MSLPSSNPRQHFITGLIGFFLGVVVCLIWQNAFSFLWPKFGFHFSTQKNTAFQAPPKDPLFELFKDDSGEDPMAQFEKMRQQMLRQTLPNLDALDPDSDQVESDTAQLGAVKQTEDEHFIYLNISIKGLDRQSLSLEVVDGQVNLKGQVHITNNRGSEMIESFNRSFPAPAKTDTKKVEIENTPELLILKFPKLMN